MTGEGSPSRPLPTWDDAPSWFSGDERPGDPACLLRRVCQQCGSVADADPPTTCPNCDADMPAD